MASGTTNHDLEDLLDGVQAVEVNIETQINALKAKLTELSNRRKALVDLLAPLPNGDEAEQGTIDAVAQLQSDMAAFDVLVPSLPE